MTRQIIELTEEQSIEELARITSVELVDIWNFLVFIQKVSKMTLNVGKPLVSDDRKIELVVVELDKRGIPHESGKRLIKVAS